MEESEKKPLQDSLTLGIDLGTTSVKICLVDRGDNSIIRTVSRETKADLPSDVSGGSEQDPSKIITTVQQCLLDVSETDRERVSCIGVTGQMHGVVMWSNVCLEGTSLSSDDIVLPDTSRLYTWQDQRCSREFLSSLPMPNSHLPLSTGHGCATVLWLSKNQPHLIKSHYHCSGTVMDLLVAMICGLNTPVTTPQLAASFGYFNTKNSTWNTKILKEAKFPCHILPTVVDSGSLAGHLQFDWLKIKKGTPVLAGLGDVQCAVFSVVKSPSDAVLNMSTSSQVMFPTMQQSLIQEKPDNTSPIQYFPYFDGGYLVMAASLNGGNVIRQFVSMLKQWMSCFDVDIPEDKMWEKLLQISSTGQGPVISPTVFGERHKPESKVTLTGIISDNLDLATVFRSLCSGLIDNLKDMMSPGLLQKHGIKTLVASGSVISRNPVIRQEVAKHYRSLNIEFGDSCDSASGVAFYCAKKLAHM